MRFTRKKKEPRGIYSKKREFRHLHGGRGIQGAFEKVFGALIHYVRGGGGFVLFTN